MANPMKKKLFIVRGYMAILSAVLFSVFLTSLVLTASGHAFLTRFNQMRHENVIRSSMRAYSCVYGALELFFTDSSYAPRDSVFPINSSETCIIDRLSVSTSSVSVFVHGVSDHSTTFLRAAVYIHPDGSLSPPDIRISTSTPP